MMPTPEHSLDVLEFQPVLALIASYAASPRGEARILALRPDAPLVEAERALLAAAQELRSEAAPLLPSRFPDPAEPLVRVQPSGAVLDAPEFLALRDFLGAVRDVVERLGGQAPSRLEACRDLAAELDACPELWAALNKVFDERGEVMDRASHDLGNIRRQISGLDRRIHKRLNALLQDADLADVLQEQLVTVRNGRMVVPVKRDQRGRFPGVVHDSSGSGATLFMEPAVVLDEANDLATARLEERDEIRRILRRLSDTTRTHLPRLNLAVRAMTRYDTVQAVAAWSEDFDCRELPVGADLRLRSARHPLLHAQFRREGREDALVPIDLVVPADLRVLAVTGPNTGGKTVTLKTVGLLVCLAATGLPAPVADESCVPAFDAVVADIGDEQSLAQNLSTFSGHLAQIREILAVADSCRALVLLDELGAGTDPLEGAALGTALLRRLAATDGLTIATTHLGAIKHVAHDEAAMGNASVLFDQDTLEPRYTVVVGRPGSSYALAIAERLGLPAELLADARNFLGEDRLRLDALLIDMDEQQRALARELEAIRVDREVAATARAAVELEQESLKKERRQLLAQSQREAAAMVDRTRRQLEDVLRRAEAAASDADEKKALRKRVEEKADKLKKGIETTRTKPSKPLDASTIAIGQHVSVPTIQASGIVLELSADGKRAAVDVDGMKVNVKIAELAAASGPRPDRKGSSQVRVNRPTGRAARIELDLRGKRVDDALRLLEAFIDDAIMGNLSEIRVIHGFGTGAVKQAVHESLTAHPAVIGFRTGRPSLDPGGEGVTHIEI